MDHVADLVYIKLIFKILSLIILSYRIHKSHSMEPVHHGRPTNRPGGHRGVSFAPMAASSRIDRGTLTGLKLSDFLHFSA